MKYTDKVELDNTFYYRDNRSERIDELQRENTLLMQENKRLQEELARLKRELGSKGSIDTEWFVHDFSGLKKVFEKSTPGHVTISCTDPDHIEVCVMGNGLTGTYQEALKNAEHIVEMHNEEVER